MSQKSSNKYLITQSLISSWLWTYKIEDKYPEFLKTLERQKAPPTKAMLEGQRFENCVNAVLDGEDIYQDHEWYKPITSLYDTLKGSQQQVSLSRDITINGINFVIYGILDYLKAGIIYDTKYSKTYHVGKYLDSPQHPFYFYIVPEAYEFKYLICDGQYIYTEKYYPDQCESIETTIKQFMAFLDKQNLVDLYCDKWKSKY